MRRLASVLILLVTACSNERAPDAPRQPDTTRPSTAPLTEIATLEGEWRVAGIDGQSFDEPYGIALSASADQIWWEPRCAGMARTYAIDGLGFSSGPAASEGPPPEPGGPPPPVCTIGLPPRLDDVVRALDGAVTIGRTPENGVAISGPDHSLLLFSQ